MQHIKPEPTESTEAYVKRSRGEVKASFGRPDGNPKLNCTHFMAKANECRLCLSLVCKKDFCIFYEPEC